MARWGLCIGERAIVAVREALGKYHGGKVVPEAPARGESQSNGTAEEAAKTVREFTRVFKEHIEDKAGIKVECGDNITLWIIRWAAMVCSRYLVGKDGRTAYERRRGRKCKDQIVAIGEKVWYKKVREGKERKDKFESEWELGIWLGRSRNSNEAIIGTSEGVVRAFAVRRIDPTEDPRNTATTRPAETGIGDTHSCQLRCSRRRGANWASGPEE